MIQVIISVKVYAWHCPEALISFKLRHKEVGIGGSHPCTHCCAVDLEVVLFPENESILVQDLRDQLYQVRCWW